MCDTGECRKCRFEARLTDRAMGSNRPLLPAPRAKVDTDRLQVGDTPEGRRRNLKAERRVSRVWVVPEGKEAAELKGSRRQKGYWVSTDVECTHGTAMGYTSWGCRCVECWGYDKTRESRRSRPAQSRISDVVGLFR